MGRVIEIHRDLFEDYFLLSVEVDLPQGRAQKVRQLLDRALGKLRQHVCVVRSHLLRGEGVIAGAQFIEDAIDIFPSVLVRALEHHVLKEVRDAVDLAGFVACASGHEDATIAIECEFSFGSAMMSSLLASWWW